MEQLSLRTLKNLGYRGYLKEKAPIKVLQFGEGNFLRAFVEDFLDQANEKANWNGKVAVIQPTPRGRKTDIINGQDGLYTLYLRGSEKERRSMKRESFLPSPVASIPTGSSTSSWKRPAAPIWNSLHPTQRKRASLTTRKRKRPIRRA